MLYPYYNIIRFPVNVNVKIIHIQKFCHLFIQSQKLYTIFIWFRGIINNNFSY